MYMGEDFTKCRDLVDGLEAQSLNLRKTLSISQSATDVAEEEILLHLDKIEKEKRNKKIWRWVAIGEAIVIGGVIYGLLK